MFPALRAIGAIGAGGVIAAFGAVGAIATAAPVAAAPLVARALSIQGVQGGPSASGAPSAPSAPGAAGPSTAPDPSRLAGAPRGGSGDFEFLMANLLVGDGMLPEALSAFEEAEKARPDSAYIHLEHAQLLARLAQAARLPSAQTGYLRQATDEVGKARRLAPHNLDVLRGVGLVYLEMAGQDPAALHTALEALETVHQSDPQDLQTAISLGRLYLEQQQPAKAAEVFREVIHESPQQRAAYALLVEALLRDDKAKEAETVLAQILDFEPAALEARLTLAELEGRRNDYAAVLATLIAAPEAERGDARLQRQLAWAYYLTGDVDRALATVEPLLQAAQAAPAAPPGPRLPPSPAAPPQTASDPDDMQLLLLKGLALAAQGHNEEAGELLETLRGTRPNDAALATILSKVLERSGHPDDAARVLADLDTNLAKAGKQDEERQARLELAQVYYDAKQWDRVSETLQPLLRLGPKEEAVREPALQLAADALIQRKSFDDALKLLDHAQAAQADPPSPTLAAKRAEVLFRAGREAEALRHLQDLAGAQDPHSALAAAEAYQRLDKYAESVPVLEKLVARPDGGLAAPGSKAAHFLLGAAYERSGKREQAVAEFRRLLDADPEYHAALNYLGYMFAERGEHLDEAQKLIEKAVALEPDNGAYVDSLGWVYYRLGRFEQARATLERATRLETADGTVQEHLGDVYGAMGQRDRAGEAYRRAIALESAEPAKAEAVKRKLDSLAGGARP
ncbi:MAG TPA: tetratricopeptide repeat protein [Thermoanaerobaculia bacterium]|nr:tetratricopeptide repeat protein [Thermoanaerobaculia bacterium]